MVFTVIVAAMNLAYGNCDADGKNFSYAPDSLMVDNVWKYKTVLTAQDYAQANWWPVIDITPSVATNEIAVATGWKKNAHDNTKEEISPDEKITNIVHYTTYDIERLYTKELKPVPAPVVPVYSVADIFFWVKTKDKQQEVDSMLEGAGYYSVAVTTRTVEAGNETFDAVIAKVKELGIFTEAEIEEGLAYSRIN